MALAATPGPKVGSDVASNVGLKGTVIGEGPGALAVTRCGKAVIPAMPTVPYEPSHRPKLRPRVPINACVARPVPKSERKLKPKATQAMKDEWK